MEEDSWCPDADQARGYQIILDFWGIPATLCEDDGVVLARLREAAIAAGCEVINTVRYKHWGATPSGISVVIVLNESHVAAHSYANGGVMAIDIFTCGTHAQAKATQLADSVKNWLGCENILQRELPRFPNNPGEHQPCEGNDAF